jgi:hypothetical protein
MAGGNNIEYNINGTQYLIFNWGQQMMLVNQEQSYFGSS